MGTPISYAADSTTLVLNGRVITDTVAGDEFTLAPVNPLTSRVNGAKNAVSIGKRVDGNVMTLTINVIKNSEDDIWLNNQKLSNYPTIFNGSLKENFMINGELRKSSWALEGGSFTDQPTDTRNNQELNVTMAYVIEFRNAVPGK